MILLAEKLEKNRELWGLVGLLHDLDLEYTEESPQYHANLSAQILEGLLPESALNAIRGHNYLYTDYLPASVLDKALVTAVGISDFIMLILIEHPDLQFIDITVEHLQQGLNDDRFTNKLQRKKIEFCNDIGITLDELFSISIHALHSLEGFH